jgi:site-specific DNA-methyltransferase (adenine-specific)
MVVGEGQKIMHEWLPQTVYETYPNNRKAAFNDIGECLSKYVRYEGAQISLCQGDATDIVRLAPSASVDLILTDPPYHSTKKRNIYGDADFQHDDQYLRWINDLSVEWKRILRPNGSLYIFCSSDMAPFIYVSLSNLYNMHSIITWTKPNEPGYDGWKQKMNKTALRRWYPHSERIIFATPATEGNLKRSSLGAFLYSCRKTCGLSSNDLTELTGAYGKINNGGAVSNWETGRNIPSRKQYQKICNAFLATGQITIMPNYEDVVRPFNANPNSFFTDVWNFKNVRQYKGKHPAEKPDELLSNIIGASSYPGDVVLDCFAGSGSTMVSAAKLGRRSIGIEIEEKWIRYAANNIEKKTLSHMNSAKYFSNNTSLQEQHNKKPEADLFSKL